MRILRKDSSRAYLALVLWLAGCSAKLPPPSSETPQPPQATAIPRAAPAPIPAPAPSSPLFAGLSQAELEAAAQEALAAYAPAWPRLAARARLVLGPIWQALAEEGAPRDLVWVVCVESGFSPYALSHAGALGLWQLMPRTARALGLHPRRDWNPRRALEASTHAAARYLLMLRARFGNWPLALAAYHMGPAALARRLARKPWRPEDGLALLPVPARTAIYVRRILGLVYAEATGKLRLPKPVATAWVELAPPVDLVRLAEEAGWSVEELFMLNPGLEFAETFSPLRLRVPEALVPLVLEAARRARPQTVQVVVRRGDTLWTIAKRAHAPLRLVRALNPGLSPRRLRIGMRVRVPARANLAFAAPRPNPLVARGRRIRYVVRPGDTLWSIARRFGVRPETIARMNGRRPEAVLRPGDTLWILARPSG